MENNEKPLRIIKSLIKAGTVSRALVIPSNFLEKLGFKEGDEFYVELNGGKLILEKIQK